MNKIATAFLMTLGVCGATFTGCVVCVAASKVQPASAAKTAPAATVAPQKADPCAASMSRSVFEDQCRNTVRANLLVPDSADFAGPFSGFVAPVRMPGCGWNWLSTVKSTNAFNVTLRREFVCALDPKTQTISLKFQH